MNFDAKKILLAKIGHQFGQFNGQNGQNSKRRASATVSNMSMIYTYLLNML